ncbi:adenylate kinase family enzyme [Streptococcus gallinaceus]|uniref:topology modulation protein n=1 Tax=Streptococcus gallinaceus TaxID=165758 RepID=UPI0020A102DC|nr:topology modulation protein [Streptococcus gallinaceus]MCP1639344.1 adenylate kinase family enzyme [Streptococcus gallinaceus]MCP1770012.1 adenylate kinase family enzyme [Streptococcus gallinaceus]
MKILIIGFSGSGKSTLAEKLSHRYKFPLLHLDKIRFAPNWVMRSDLDFSSDLEHFLDQHDSWVMDGFYSKFSLKRRLEEADQIIFLNFNRWTALHRILKRYLTYRGKVRSSAPDGCQEKIDWPFLKFVMIDSHKPNRQQLYHDIEKQYTKKIITLKNQKEIDDFLRRTEQKLT